MSAQVFVIEGELMALNEYVNICRKHWSAGNKAKREQTDLMSAYIKKAHVKPYDGPVEIGISWIEGKRRRRQLRDVDNVMFGTKFILDALKECHVIHDDNPYFVRNVYSYFKFNAENPRIEVTVMDYDPRGRTVHYLPVTGLDEVKS